MHRMVCSIPEDLSNLFFLEILPLIYFRIMFTSSVKISYASMLHSFWSTNTKKSFPFLSGFQPMNFSNI